MLTSSLRYASTNISENVLGAEKYSREFEATRPRKIAALFGHLLGLSQVQPSNHLTTNFKTGGIQR